MQDHTLGINDLQSRLYEEVEQNQRLLILSKERILSYHRMSPKELWLRAACYYLATAALRTWVRKNPPLVRSMTC
jgi:hypothetical protein